MKKLLIPYYTDFTQEASPVACNQYLNGLEKQAIDQVNWNAYPYKPKVQFVMAHTGDRTLLKFFVEEKQIRAQYSHTNDPVYKDSCVEFFISPQGDPGYFNFEINCVGVCLGGYGEDRNHRHLLPPTLLDTIERQVFILHKQEEGEPLVYWEQIIQIPLAVFGLKTIDTFKGMHARGNFYKCGDELDNPHYVSWNPIDTAEPNFHVPACFGALEFASA